MGEERTIKRPKRIRQKYELDVLHPYVAQMLRNKGFEFDHEVSLPIGRPDFVAMHTKRGHEALIVEVKKKIGNGEAINAPIMQIASYVFIYGASTGQKARGVLAVPVDQMTDGARIMCKTLGIGVWDLYPDISREEYNNLMSEMHPDDQYQWIYARKRSIHPKYADLPLPTVTRKIYHERGLRAIRTD